MKVKELIKELEMYDKELDVKAMLKSGEPYEFVGIHVGTYTKKSEVKILTCPNCGFTTKSVFEFTEHYENDATGRCEDVQY